MFTPSSRLVVDVSNRNPVHAADLAALPLAGLIAKATEGGGYHDPFLAQHRAAAKDLRLPFGSYLFLRPGDARDQADFFLAYAQPAPDELVAVDVEVTDGLDMGAVASRAYTCLALLERRGCAPLLYASASWWRELRQLEPRLQRFKVWEAQYPGATRWAPALAALRWKLGAGATLGLWQWTDHLQVGGRFFDASRLYVPFQSLTPAGAL